MAVSVYHFWIIDIHGADKLERDSIFFQIDLHVHIFNVFARVNNLLHITGNNDLMNKGRKFEDIFKNETV